MELGKGLMTAEAEPRQQLSVPAPFYSCPGEQRLRISQRGTRAPFFWHLNKKQLLEAERGMAQGKGPHCINERSRGHSRGFPITSGRVSLM